VILRSRSPVQARQPGTKPGQRSSRAKYPLERTRMPEAATLVREVIGRCREAAFTGVVRIRGDQGEGELLFLSGIVDEAKIGNQTGEDALQTLESWGTRDISVQPRLPGPAGGFKEEVPLEGDLGKLPPLELFRYCEGNAITCRLELRSRGLTGEATY